MLRCGVCGSEKGPPVLWPTQILLPWGDGGPGCLPGGCCGRDGGRDCRVHRGLARPYLSKVFGNGRRAPRVGSFVRSGPRVETALGPGACSCTARSERQGKKDAQRDHIIKKRRPCAIADLPGRRPLEAGTGDQRGRNLEVYLQHSRPLSVIWRTPGAVAASKVLEATGVSWL